MAREIKTRFVLEGEQKFKSAMKDSANAIKVLNSEQKLAKAQFQQTGDAEKYAAQQTEILKQKIEEQKSAVEAAEQAIRQLSENGVAENSRQMQQWKIRLNDAQAALAQMETDLQNVGSESSATAAEADNLGTSLASLDKKASLEAVVESVNRLSEGLGTALIKVKDLAKGLVSELTEAASWADDLATTALVYGMDKEQLQRMQFAAQLVDTDVETIIKSRQKLEQAMKQARPNLGSEEFEKEKKSVNEYEQAFAQLGVEIMRYGQYRDWEDVFWEAGDALMHMTDGLDEFGAANAEIIRDTTAQQLFGKSWRELIPLFTAGRQGYQAALDEAAVVSDEDVDKLTALDDELVKLKNQFDVLEKTVLAQLAPALTDLATSLGNVLKELNEYLQTEEGQQKLNEISEAVRGLFGDLTNVDFSSVLETVKSALDSVVDALEWLKDHGNEVKLAIEGIVGAWMALKVTSGISTMLQLVTGLKGFLPGAGGSAAKKVTDVLPTPGSNNITDDIARGGTFYAIWQAIKAKVPALAEKAAELGRNGGGNLATAAVMGGIALGDKTEFGRTLRDGGTIQEALNRSGKAFEDWQRSVEQNINTFTEDWTNLWNTVTGQGTEETPIALPAESVELPTKEELEQRLMQDLGTSDPIRLKLAMEVNPVKPAGSDGYWSSGNPVVKMKDEAEAAAPALEQSMDTIGGNASAGLANGINARSGEAVAAAAALAAAVQATLQSVLQIHSPSRVMMQLGEYVTQGFAEGIESQLGLVNRAADRMTGSINMNPSFAGTGRNGGMIDVSLYLGPDQLTEIITPLMNDAMGEEIALVRR